MDMSVRCPNCGTTFIESNHGKAVSKYDLIKGEWSLVPKEIHNDNIGRNNTEEITSKTTTQKEEVKGMNNMNNGFDMETLAKMVATMINNGNATTVETKTNVFDQVKTTKTTYANVTDGVVDKNGWAKTSKYYGKEICGYAFNPYMIRFKLQQQFEELMSEAEDLNVHGLIAKKYPYMYSVEYTIEEVRKLAMLKKRSKIAYDERSKTFDLYSCKEILAEYVENAIREVDFRINKEVMKTAPGNEIKGNLKGYGHFTWGTVCEKIEKHRIVKYLEYSEELKAVFFNLEELEKQILRCWSYKELFETMPSKLIKVNEKVKKSRAFMNCFIKAGAYYTLKQTLMFDDTVEFKKMHGREAVETLRNYLNRKDVEGYVFYAFLKKAKGLPVNSSIWGEI